jgi:eukaryotic-like serine/threonine-protein kinase
VSFFDRIRGLFRKQPAEAKETEPPKQEPVETGAMRAGHAVAQARLDDALSMLRAARETADEASVLDAILMSLPDEAPENPGRAWDDLILLLAEVLTQRGDRARACEQLRRARSTAAKIVRADLLCEGTDGPATPAELDLALSLLSEVLRENIDAPGARERWERLRVRLGRGGEIAATAMGATLLVDGPALPFTLVREVARGGSGVVYEARSSILAIERTVGLKLAHQRSTARTFLAHEARIAARFRGPGVVPILDVDPEEGWLAMAWAAGGSLRMHLRGGEDAILRDAARWIAALTSTLADIHRDGWVHGDLKPANVLFDHDGEVWLGDFALARTCGEAATAGSAGYISPERMNGAPCDPRDDIFALGKIMLEVPTLARDPRYAALAEQCVASATNRPTDACAVLAMMS